MITSFYQKIKLFSSDRKEFYLFLKDLLGFFPGNTRLYDIAFVHRSASLKDSLGKPINNERLEYLGDAVLGAVVAEYLYNRFPQRGEGFLTQMRSKLVNRIFLSELMHKMGLEQFVRSRNAGSTVTNSSIYGDAFEALIGAIYLDKGYEKAKYVIVKQILNEFVDLNTVEEVDENYKSQLIEWGQKNKQEINFLTEEESNSQTNGSFVSIVEVENIEKGKGRGASKKEAQQNAAKKAMEALQINTDE